MTYFVYSGYVSPDNCGGERLTHEINKFNTEKEVMAFYKEFKENLHSECYLVEFRVFKGKELNIKPREVITEWVLE